MTDWPVYHRIDGPIVMIGFGSIGRGTLPLIERHFAFDRSKLVVIDPCDDDRALLDERGVRFLQQAVTRDNYRDLLIPLLTAGPGQGFCVNLSVDTSSLDIMQLAREVGALYIDTVVEPWAGFYFDPTVKPEARSNYALRETVLAARRNNPGGTTAVSCCGANPGMVSWFVKQALVNLAADLGLKREEPTTREEWAQARDAISASRASTSPSAIPSAPRFPSRSTCSSTPGRSRASCRRACSRRNSAGAPLSAGCRTMPAPTRRAAAPRSISCSPAPTPACAPGRRRRRRNTASWSPTTNRSRSPTSSRCATRAAKRSTGRPATTPITPATTRCCRCTRCSAAAGKRQSDWLILDEKEIVDGIDELGVLLYGHGKNAYWFGSQLSIEETRRIAPYQNATGLQVSSAVLAGMVWALENPTAGIVEADDLDYRRCLEVQMPYLGPVIGAYTDWTPLNGRPGLFPEDIDTADPWQFRNVLVRD